VEQALSGEAAQVGGGLESLLALVEERCTLLVREYSLPCDLIPQVAEVLEVELDLIVAAAVAA